MENDTEMSAGKVLSAAGDKLNGALRAALGDPAQWLRALRRGGDEWHELTLALPDQSNDDLNVYARLTHDVIEFSDDGFTLATMTQRGIELTPAVLTRIAEMLQHYGARLQQGEIMLSASGNAGNGVADTVSADNATAAGDANAVDVANDASTNNGSETQTAKTSEAIHLDALRRYVQALVSVNELARNTRELRAA